MHRCARTATILLLLIQSAVSAQVLLTVADDDADFDSVQDAVDDIPKNLDASYIIEIQDNDTYEENVVVKKNTTSEFTITIRGQQGRRPTIESDDDKKPAIKIRSPYVTIENLTLVGTERGPGVHIAVVNDCTIRRCTIRDASEGTTAGIVVQGAARTQILDNLIIDNRVGILLRDEDADDCLIRNNRIVDNALRGIWLFRKIDGNRIINNTLARNGLEIHLGNAGKSKDEPGEGNVFRNNVLWAEGNKAIAFAVDRDGDPATLPGSTLSDYNLIHTVGQAIVGRLDDSEFSDLAAWQSGAGVDLHSIAADPLFVDLPDDLHVQSTAGSYHDGDWQADGNDSPAIDAGDPSDSVGDESTPSGDRINIGAYGGTAEASLSAEVVAAVPVGAFNSATAQTDASGGVDVSIEAEHGDGTDVRARLEWSTAADRSFAPATLSTPVSADVDDSGGPPNVDNSATYQLGNGADTRIVTDSGSNSVGFVWDATSDVPANADAAFYLRLTLNDDTVDQTTPAAISVVLDNAAPSGHGSLTAANVTVESVDLEWTSVSQESHFRDYAIWYGTDRGAVQSRSGSAAAWGVDQDGDLAQQSTGSTTITGLSRGTTYAARLWARDTYGNEASAELISFTTAGLDTVRHYVSASSGSKDGTANDPSAPWNTIMRAVNAIPKKVTEQQSTFVVEILDSSVYEERVVIDKNTDAQYSVRLRPAAGQSPTIQAPNGKIALIIKADYAIVEDLSITGRPNKIGVDINSPNSVTLRRCVINGNGTSVSGLRLNKADNCTIQDNLIANAETGVHIKNADGNVLLRNRILDDNERLRGVYFDDKTDGNSLVNNTIVGFQSGLRFRGGNKPAGNSNTLRNTIVHDVGTAIHLDGPLGQILSSSDFNDLSPSPGGSVGSIDGASHGSLADWRAASNLDEHSLTLDPLLASTAGAATGWDVHLMSQAGRWDGSGFVSDDNTSPAIDAGNPRDDFSLEPSPNGNRINLGAYGNTVEASRAGPVSVVLGGVPWNEYIHITMPLQPLDGNPDAVLSDDFPGEGDEDPWGFWWRVVRWDTRANDYVYYKEDIGPSGNPPDFAAGRGHWLIQWWSLINPDGSTEGDTVTVTGTPVSVTENFAARLDAPAGGNFGVTQLGNPFLFDIDWADALVRDRSSGRIGTVERAAEAGWIDGHAYLWDWEAGEYVNLPPGEGGRIAMWRGFWIEQLEAGLDLEILLPPVAASASAGKRAQQIATAENWFIEFEVETVSAEARLADTNNRLGVRLDASRRNDQYDALHLAGLATPFLSAYFPHDDPRATLTYWPDRPGRYTYDFRDPEWDEQEWTFVVETDLLDEPLLWRWSGGQAPLGYRLSVVDDDTDSVLTPDLSQQPTFGFSSGPEGRRAFRLVAEYSDVPGDVTGDRLIDEEDVDLTLRHALDVESIPSFAVPFGEVSGNVTSTVGQDSSEAISALDASWILRYALGQTNRFPVNGAEIPTTSPSAREVFLGQPVPVGPDLWDVPLVVDPADGVWSSQVQVTYDGARMQIADVTSAQQDSRLGHVDSDEALHLAVAAAATSSGRQVTARIRVANAIDGEGLIDYLTIDSAELNEGSVATKIAASRPETTILFPPSPNPFNGEVTLRFGMPEEGDVVVSLYNVLGQRIRTLVQATRPAGLYRMTWDARDDGGQPVASGLYFARLESGGRTLTHKVTLVR